MSAAAHGGRAVSPIGLRARWATRSPLTREREKERERERASYSPLIHRVLQTRTDCTRYFSRARGVAQTAAQRRIISVRGKSTGRGGLIIFGAWREFCNWSGNFRRSLCMYNNSALFYAIRK